MKSDTFTRGIGLSNVDSSTKTKEQTQEYGFYKKGYLVLKRKEGQGVFIDSETEVVVAKVVGNITYLAIKAPNKKVLRSEIVANEPRKKEPVTS